MGLDYQRLILRKQFMKLLLRECDIKDAISGTDIYENLDIFAIKC